MLSGIKKAIGSHRLIAFLLKMVSCMLFLLIFGDYILYLNISKTDSRWLRLTGISPRPILMGAPRNTLRVFNAGVSLIGIEVMASALPHALQTDEIAHPNAPFSADHSASSAGLTLSRNVIRLLMQRRARFQGANGNGCVSARKGSCSARAFPHGCIVFFGGSMERGT